MRLNFVFSHDYSVSGSCLLWGFIAIDTCHQDKSSVYHPAFLLLHTIGSIYLLNPRGTNKTHSFLRRFTSHLSNWLLNRRLHFIRRLQLIVINSLPPCLDSIPALIQIIGLKPHIHTTFFASLPDSEWSFIPSVSTPFVFPILWSLPQLSTDRHNSGIFRILN